MHVLRVSGIDKTNFGADCAMFVQGAAEMCYSSCEGTSLRLRAPSLVLEQRLGRGVKRLCKAPVD